MYKLDIPSSPVQQEARVSDENIIKKDLLRLLSSIYQVSQVPSVKSSRSLSERARSVSYFSRCYSKSRQNSLEDIPAKASARSWSDITISDFTKPLKIVSSMNVLEFSEVLSQTNLHSYRHL